MIDSTLYRCTGCGAAVIGHQTCGDPTRPECASLLHQPWCTDHLYEDPADPLTEGVDECVAVVDVLPAGGGFGDVALTATRNPGQTEVVVTVESYSRPLSVDEARQVHLELGRLLERLEP